MTLEHSMKNKSFIKQVREFAIANMGREASHDFSHALRVGNLARKIAISEGLERPVLYEVAGLLHDIGLGLCERKDHGEKGDRDRPMCRLFPKIFLQQVKA